MSVFTYYRTNVYHTSSVNEPKFWLSNYFFRRTLLSTLFGQKVPANTISSFAKSTQVEIAPTDEDIKSGLPTNPDKSVNLNSYIVDGSDLTLDYATSAPVFKYYSIGCVPATAFGIGVPLTSNEYPFSTNSELKEVGKYHYLIGTESNSQLSPWFFVQDAQSALEQRVTLLNPPRFFIQGNPNYGDLSGGGTEWETDTRTKWENMNHPMVPFEVIRGEFSAPPLGNQLVNISFETYIDFDNFALEKSLPNIYNLTRLKIEVDLHNSDISSLLIGTNVDTTSDGRVRIGEYIYLNSLVLFDQYFQPLLIGVFPIVPINESMPIQLTFCANMDTRNIY